MKTFLIIIGILLIFSRSLRNLIIQSVTGIIEWIKDWDRTRYIKDQILEVQKLVDEMGEIIIENFVTEPCFQCFENKMVLDKVSSSGKSISYSCTNCSKEMLAPALNKEAEKIAIYWDKIQEIAEAMPEKIDYDKTVTFAINFKTQEAIMPYDQTFTGTIPAEVKSEVWQRDGGKCVKCGSKEQLLFDQTIPVKNGAVITARNIKIVCKSCNQGKTIKNNTLT